MNLTFDNYNQIRGENCLVGKADAIGIKYGQLFRVILRKRLLLKDVPKCLYGD